MQSRSYDATCLGSLKKIESERMQAETRQWKLDQLSDAAHSSRKAVDIQVKSTYQRYEMNSGGGMLANTYLGRLPAVGYGSKRHQDLNEACNVGFN